MEAKARCNAVARAVLLWLDDEGDNHPLVEDFLTLPAAHVGDEMVGNDELVRTVRWLDARNLIDGPRIDQVPYPVKLRLTDAGRIVVIEQDGWVEPSAAASASSAAPAPKPPLNMVAQAFLRWLYDHNQQQPTPAKFLDDPRSRIDDHQVDHDEMIEAVELLEAKQLVKGAKSWGSSIPLRISLTAEGRIRVVEHDATPSGTGPTRTFDDVTHGVPMVDKSVTITGSGNQVVSHSSNANQSLTDATPQPDFAINYSGRADRGHHIEVRMISGPEQLDVGVGVAVLEPQDRFTATVTGGGARRMVRDLTREIIVVIDPPVIDTAVAVEIVVTCQDLGESDRRWALHRSLTIPRPATIHCAQVGHIPPSTEVRPRPRSRESMEKAATQERMQDALIHQVVLDAVSGISRTPFKDMLNTAGQADTRWVDPKSISARVLGKLPQGSDVIAVEAVSQWPFKTTLVIYLSAGIAFYEVGSDIKYITWEELGRCDIEVKEDEYKGSKGGPPYPLGPVMVTRSVFLKSPDSSKSIFLQGRKWGLVSHQLSDLIRSLKPFIAT